ncbi:MAG: PAS domain-containing sensor histidine kinase, partial [Caulobacteraceae bacterium]
PSSSTVAPVTLRPGCNWARSAPGASGWPHPDDAAAANAMLEAAIAAGQGFSAQARVRRPDGSWRTLLNRTTCRRDAAGKVTSVIGVVMDVTEATATDEALRRSEARYRLLADNATDLIVRTDRKGAILYMSPACQSMGWEPEELIGRNCAEQVHPDDLPKLIESGERLWAGQNVVDPELNELRYRTRDGEWRWLQGAPKVIFDEDGRPSEVVNVLRDVTERRRTAAALAEARRLAEAAAEAKAQFLANMSHEIRTPLTAILGFSGLLESLEGLPETAELFVRRIRTAGAQLLSLVNDVLDFSRLEAGQVELDPQPLDLVEFCAETVDLMGAQATAKGLRLELTCGTDIPSLVLADALRLRQVLVNLIGNAIKFTDRGSVRVRLERKAEAIFKVSVLDTGRGIPRRQRSRLFERFSQLDSRTSRGHGGSGLGLAICKALTGLMGGAIGVE